MDLLDQFLAKRRSMIAAYGRLRRKRADLEARFCPPTYALIVARSDAAKLVRELAGFGDDQESYWGA